MKALEEKILKDGHVAVGNILKVDSFINHQVDTKLIDELGEYFSKMVVLLRKNVIEYNYKKVIIYQ